MENSPNISTSREWVVEKTRNYHLNTTTNAMIKDHNMQTGAF